MKQPSSTATQASTNSATVVPGTSVTDTATVTGQWSDADGVGHVLPLSAGRCHGCWLSDWCGRPGRWRDRARRGGGDLALDRHTTAIGKYCWRAVYSGDGFYNGSTHTNAARSASRPRSRTPETDTLSDPTGGGVVPGTQVRDNATVTGITDGPPPSGTVTFRLCGPDPQLATDISAGGCVGGTLVGGAVSLTAGAGNPPTATAQSILAASTLTNVVGKYCWSAAYSGDDFYNGSVHTDSTNECFTVGLQASTTTTAASTQSSTVVPGTSVTDTATVAGVAGVPVPTGTVTFFLCQPATVVLNDGDCHFGGAQVGGAKTLANGVATSDATTNTTSIGTYCWRAVYEGDALYTGSSELTSTNECFTTVKQPSTTATTSSPTGGNVLPGGSATDHAVVAGGAGQPTPTGTVAFFLCQPADVTAGGCEGTAGTQVGPANSLAGGEATSVASTNTVSNGTYCWRAEYSGDAFYNPSTHTNTTTECFTVESGTITVIKDFVGAPADSTVTLNIKHGDNVVDETDASVVDGGRIGPKVLLPGTYVVNETSAGNNVDLDLYTSSIVCTKPGEGDPVPVGSADGRSINVELANGEAITCTITNTRKARSITVQKTVSATSDGEFVTAPDVATKPENGGTFYFKVKITNESAADTITVTSLADIVGDSGVDVDNLVCDGADQENLDGLPFELGPGPLEDVPFHARSDRWPR